MSTIDTMNLNEIEATITELRTRRKALKSSHLTAQRKIVSLARRRERLMQQVHVLDEQIIRLRGNNQQETVTDRPQPSAQQRRTRRTQTDITQCLEAIMTCVQHHTITQRATIIAECGLSPANASAYLRQLCKAGKLIRRGEKRATTYTLR